MNTKKKSLIACLTAFSLLTGCSGEAAPEENSSDVNVGVQPPENSDNEKNPQDYTEDGRLRIVMECQHSHIREDFEENLEAQFPGIDLEIKYNYSQNVMFSLEQSLSHNLAPDFYVCEFLPNLGDDMLSEYFYDMAAESFVNRYYLSAIEGCSTAEGGLYYLPGPSYVYGIIYDKTAFKELGLSVPDSYSEFVKLIETVNNMGLTGFEPDPADAEKQLEVPVQAFVPTIMWPDMFQIIFNTLNYEDSFRGMANAKWLEDYRDGTGSLVGHMESAAEKFLKLFEDGVLTLDMWEMKPFYRTQKLYRYHTSLMTIECQQGFEYNNTYGTKEPDNFHEVGIMPIYTSDEPDSGYLYGIPRSYFGIANQGAENPEKLSAMLEIMDYLSTVEGQKHLISGPDYFGFLKNESDPDGPFYSEVEEEILGDRVINRFFLGGRQSRGRIESYLHEQTPALVKGEITVEQWLKGADEVRDNLLNPEPQKVYGTVSETLLPVQSAYVEGEALLHSTDADIGYIQAGHNYGTDQYMFSGDITEKLIKFISPEISSVAQPIEGDMDFVVVELTGEQLIDCVINDSNNKNGRGAFAGVEMTVDLSKTGKEQFVSLKIGGEEMDMNKTYRVAAIRGSVPDYTPAEEYKELKFMDIFLKYLDEAAGGVIKPPTGITVLNG